MRKSQADRLAAAAVWENPAALVLWKDNPRDNDDTVPQVAESIRKYGFGAPVVCRLANKMVIAGHTRVKAAIGLALKRIPVRYLDLSQEAAEELALADNRLGEFTKWNPEKLAALLRKYDQSTLQVLGWKPLDVAALLRAGKGEDAAAAQAAATLAERFVVPPFSVLDARQGYWRDRKTAWMALGLKSFQGREAVVEGAAPGKKKGKGAMQGVLNSLVFIQDGKAARLDAKGEARAGAPGKAGPMSEAEVVLTLSIFDPVLCEVAYRWFCPPGGVVLDPFAGGSVRGLVANRLGRRYFGVDLRPEQVESNRAQWAAVGQRFKARVSDPIPDAFLNTCTPTTKQGQVWMKRDDLFAVAGVAGGKVRTCWALAQGAVGLVTAGSRQSPQVNIVAHIAKRLGIPCRVHVPAGELTPELVSAQAAGAEIVVHRPGYNSVIVARARADAGERGWTEIPFGMECEEAVRQTASQVAALPKRVNRIVIPVGSGMTLAGVLHGLRALKDERRVVGVVVGADPVARLDKYAPKGWRDWVQLVPAGIDYHKHAPVTVVDGVELDPVYEAKCIPFLEPGDLLWVVGIRETSRTATVELEPTWLVGDAAQLPKVKGLPAKVDLVFSCPPYMDLEVYSGDARDLSAQGDADFWLNYRQAIKDAVARLRPDRFVVWVIGEVRAPDGGYKNFVSGTVEAFEAEGCRYYNEAIMVTPAGTLPLRAGGQFTTSRKLGRAHQNVMVFVKGDWRKAVEACGDVSVVIPDLEAAPE